MFHRFFFLKTIGSSITEYVNLILVFMGDITRLNNPHLRATLADVLEDILLNKQSSNDRTLNQLVDFFDYLLIYTCFFLVHMLKKLFKNIH